MTSTEIDRQFTEIAERTMPRLRRAAFLMTSNWADADDLIQSTYLKAYKYARRVCSVESPEAYLRQILVRTSIDEHRRHRVTEVLGGELPDSGGPIDAGDERWVIRPALAKIAYSQRQILVLRFFLGLSVSDTAAMLGCTVGTVKSQTSRGLDALARNLGIERPLAASRHHGPTKATTAAALDRAC